MADLDTSSRDNKKKGPGVKKQAKKSLRVDLTPMVDLGFLLITFFVFTTTMSQPTGMFLNMPDDRVKPGEETLTAESGALTILLGKNNNVYYYEGLLKPDASNVEGSSFKEIRDVIINKKQNTPEKDFMVLIKPGNESTYKNIVDILDEMAINGVERYALINNVEEADQTAIQLSDAAN